MDFTPLLLKVIESNETYNDVLKVIRMNSKGRLWLVGSQVYQNIAHELYGTSKPREEIDFIVAESIQTFNLPNDWKLEFNRFGNPRFVTPNLKIDYIPLKIIHYIVRKSLNPTIENYLESVPINVQSIAFDILEKRIIGEAGIEALLKRKIKIHNHEQAQFCPQFNDMSIEDLVKKIAKRLGFDY